MFTRREPRLQAGTYVDGLLSEIPRKNGWSLAERAGDRSPDKIQRLLNHAVWDVQPATGPVDPAFGPGTAGDDWIDTPSGETIQVRDARLGLTLDDPAGDTPTDGARPPYLDVYLAERTTDLPDGPVTFTVPPAGG